MEKSRAGDDSQTAILNLPEPHRLVVLDVEGVEAEVAGDAGAVKVLVGDAAAVADEFAEAAEEEDLGEAALGDGEEGLGGEGVGKGFRGEVDEVRDWGEGWSEAVRMRTNWLNERSGEGETYR